MAARVRHVQPCQFLLDFWFVCKMIHIRFKIGIFVDMVSCDQFWLGTFIARINIVHIACIPYWAIMAESTNSCTYNIVHVWIENRTFRPRGPSSAVSDLTAEVEELKKVIAEEDLRGAEMYCFWCISSTLFAQEFVDSAILQWSIINEPL